MPFFFHFFTFFGKNISSKNGYKIRPVSRFFESRLFVTLKRVSLKVKNRFGKDFLEEKEETKKHLLTTQYVRIKVFVGR